MGKIVSCINHSSITVRDLEESLKFYKKYLGLKKVNEFVLSIDAEGSLEGVTIKAAYLQAGDDAFELIEYQNKKADRSNDLNSWDVGAQHIAFSVDSVEKLYNKFKDEISFLSTPIHSKAEGLDATWTYLKDPNGAIIELSEDHLGKEVK